MIKVLKQRFGKANQSDKYRLELKSRRRRPNETLRNLHSNIRRLAALSLPELEHGACETMACDYFIDALGDPKFALKVRERSPKDSAFESLSRWKYGLGMSSRAAEGAQSSGNNGARKEGRADQRAQEAGCRATETAYGAAEKGPDNGAQQASRRARSSANRGKELHNDCSRSCS